MAFTLTQPLYGQGGSYTAQQDRLFIKATAVTQGVRKLTAASGGVMTGDLAVTTSGTTNGSVFVAAGEVIVASSTASQGHYFANNDGSTLVGSFTANSSGNPRIDLVTVLITDTGATPVVSFAIVAGTPAATPSAPATPSNSLALAQVTIPNGFTVSTTVAAGNIVDVRQKAFVPDLSTTSVSSTVIPSPTDGNLVYHTTGKQLATYNATTAAWEGSPQTAGFRNVLMNSNMDVWQRGTSITVPSGYGYGADRWRTYSYGANTTTLSQQSFTVGSPAATGFEAQYFLRGIATQSQLVISQPIENVRTLAGTTVTFSFYAKAASGTPTITPSLRQYFGTGGSPSADVTTTGSAITLSTSWARYQQTFIVPSITGKTLGTANDHYLDFTLITTTLNVNFDFWGCQLEQGSVASPFERRPIGAELALCQRYFWRSVSRTNDGAVGSGVVYNTTSVFFNISYPVPSRSNAPTVTASSGNALEAVVGGTVLGSSALGFGEASYYGAQGNATISGGSVGQGAFVRFGVTQDYVQMSDEL